MELILIDKTDKYNLIVGSSLPNYFFNYFFIIIMLNLSKIQYWFLIGKKAKIYKKPLYEAIPHLHKPHYIDIHEGYTKRTKE